MKIFLFSFKMAIKTAASAQKNRVGRVSGYTVIFFGLSVVVHFRSGGRGFEPGPHHTSDIKSGNSDCLALHSAF